MTNRQKDASRRSIRKAAMKRSEKQRDRARKAGSSRTYAFDPKKHAVV
jgi:hypothetical protein